jgi:hypothetical protein
MIFSFAPFSLLFVFAVLLALPLLTVCDEPASSTASSSPSTCTGYSCPSETSCILTEGHPTCIANENEESSGSLTSLWVVLALVVAVIIIERLYTYSKRYLQRKNGTEGFSQLAPNSVEEGFGDSMEMIKPNGNS